jgi:hypothetical protein
MFWKNILILVEEQKNLIQSFCHITLSYILVKKFALCPKKKVKILTLVLSNENNSERKKIR